MSPRPRPCAMEAACCTRPFRATVPPTTRHAVRRPVASSTRSKPTVYVWVVVWQDGRPNKLHTSAYVYRPKPGESGEEYTYSLVRRAGMFCHLGHRVHQVLCQPGVSQDQVVEAPCPMPNAPST